MRALLVDDNTVRNVIEAHEGFGHPDFEVVWDPPAGVDIGWIRVAAGQWQPPDESDTSTEPQPLTRTEWLGLWTPDELVAWELFPDQTTDPQARAEWRVWEKWFAALDRYDLASPRMSEMAAWAVSHGLLTQTRADAILSG